MLSLGALAFAAPWMLALGFTLPVIWWLLRLMPPAPRLVRFPAIRLLLGLKPEEETPQRLPIWLAILRLLLATLIILALAKPLLNPDAGLEGTGPLVLAIDDGWAAAPGWSQRQAQAERLIDRAERAERSVALIATAPPALDEAPLPRGLLRPNDARAALRALKPKPWPTDRAAAARAAAALELPSDGTVVWIGDGLQDGGTDAFAQALQRFGALQVLLPEAEVAPVLLLPPTVVGTDLRVRAERAGGGPMRYGVQASDEQGRALARVELDFADGARQAETPLNLPNEVRNRLTRLDVERQGGAGAAVLLDERYRRRPVGIAGTSGAESSQPLLSEIFYLDRALNPFSSIAVGDIANLLTQPLAVLLLPDSAAPSAQDRAALEKWMEDGGVLVRFAGPRLASGEDTLTPVRLRAGDRALGGVMTWGEPATLAGFGEQGPFANLTVPSDVRVRQQVLAEPALDLADKTWARLSDGTPLVTGERRGQGWLVLVHTTANPDWSNLSLSGLFVEMLQRLVALSRGVTGGGSAAVLRPWRVLDGFGHLGQPPAGARPLTGEAQANFVPGPHTPPGLYGDESAQQAFNLGGRLPPLAALTGLPAGARLGSIETAGEIDLLPFVLTAALVLLLIDLLLALWLRGLLPAAFRWRRAGGGAAAAILLAVLAGTATPPRQAVAQNVAQSTSPGAQDTAAGAQTDTALAMKASLETRLAYVVTGNRDVDETSRAGLVGLGEILRQRTSVEPAEPIGLDPERDELRLFPFIYWPITPDQQALSREAAASVDRFLKSGGMLLIDTRDQYITGGQTGVGPGARDLRRLLQGIEIPPLIAMPKDHVIGKAFYLLSEFPGRWAGGSLWLEAGDGRVNDGVSSLIVGGNDWAGAWAVNGRGEPMLPVSPGGPNQRELAYRFGVNLVMYALTGNYKDDQVHLPKILERLAP